MADRNQLRAARDHDFTESDPLAELTRIMGFDPRVEPAPPLDDDLGIDLERELMGELGADAAHAVSHASAPVPDRSAAYDQRRDLGAANEPAAARGDDEFDDLALDDALAAGFEEAIVADHPDAHDEPMPEYRPEAAGYRSEELPTPVDAEDIDMDFSGHLSPAIDAAAEVAGERYLEEHAPADEVPDLEAELGELLDALGAHHHEVDHVPGGRGLHLAPAEDDALTEGESAAVAHEEIAYAPDDEASAGEWATETSYETSDISDHDQYSADRDDHEDGSDEAGATVAAGPEEPRDEILDQLFGTAGAQSEIEVSAAHGEDADRTAFSRDAQGSEMDFLADGENELANDPRDGTEAVTDDPLPDIEDLDTEPETVAAGDADVPEFMEAAHEEPIFDESEFEAALAGEFTRHDFAPAVGDEGSGDFSAETADQPWAGDSEHRELAEFSDFTAEADGETRSPDKSHEDAFATLSSMGLPSAAHTAVADQADHVRDDAYASDAPEAEDRHGGAYAAAPGHSTDELPPEIDTVEVPERAVALPDDLDLPELRLQEEAPHASAYDDLEAEFADVFNGANANLPEAGSASTHGPEPLEDGGFDHQFDRLFELEDDFAGGHAAAAVANGAGTYGSHYAAQASRAVVPAEAAAPPLAVAADADGVAHGLDYDPAYDVGLTATPETDGQALRKRGFLVAAVVAGLAFVGGAGAFVYSFSNVGDDAPVLVKADPDPVKVKPENPGGTVVPNQDNKVYERVTEGVLDAPSQEKLISGSEEPVELATRSPEATTIAPALAPANDLPGVDLAPVEAAPPDALPLPKSEDRIEPSDIESVIANDEIAAVTPRRVRTMIVKPDGTLVPRPEPEPAPEPVMQPEAGSEAGALEQPAVSVPALAPAPMSAEPAAIAAQPAVLEAEAATTAPAVLPAAETAAAQPLEIAAQPADLAATPARVPVAPSRPGDQPIEIVGEVPTREKLAALARPSEPKQEIAAASAEPAAPGWSMQISSQPSHESAQATYVNLARRYGAVLGGHSVNIVKADIAGRGTFYRVRIPADSRDAAIDLCERYKAAGGSCFVSQ